MESQLNATQANFTPARSQNNNDGQYVCRATQITPAWECSTPGGFVFLDSEFQNFKHFSWQKWRHRAGRVTITNVLDQPILDVYLAYPREDGVVKRMPPERFMVAKEDLLFSNGAQHAHQVETWVKEIVKDRTVVVHGGKHDLTAFVIEPDVFARSTIVDTQEEYSYLQSDGTPGLAMCAAAILGESVQEVAHSPLEDAQTTRKLWSLRYPGAYQAELAKFAERETG